MTFQDFCTIYAYLEQIYDNRTNTPDIVNVTKYINVNIASNDNLKDNDIIQTRRFQLSDLGHIYDKIKKFLRKILR